MLPAETSALPVDRLLRGLRTARVSMTWNALAELRLLGPDWVPSLRGKLRTKDWAVSPRGRGDKSLGILLAILDELDRDSFEAEVSRLQRRDLHPHHGRTVDLLAQRLSDNPAGHVGRGVPVHVARELGDPDEILSALKPWVRRTRRHVDKIARIDIAAKYGNDDLSRYNPLFSGVMLSWPSAKTIAAEKKTALMQPEFMFYRAIGYHARGSEGGSFDDRDEASDRYAVRAFRRAHPFAARKFMAKADLADRAR